MNSTARHRIRIGEDPDYYPPELKSLDDAQWFVALASLIAADIPKLDEESQQVVFEDLIYLRHWTHVRAVAA